MESKKTRNMELKAGVVLLVAMVILPGLSVVSTVKGDVPASPHAVNQIIIKLRSGYTLQSLGLSSHYGLLDSEGNLSSYLLSISGISEEQALQELSAKSGVAFAELNIEMRAFFEPNDPLWQYQYGPKNIQCPAAWDIEKGDSSIVVSVVDTGIDYTHPDLVNHYKASGSWNFVAHNADPLDDCGHGTHCAGIIAAEANNGIDIAGIADVKIIAMKVLDASGSAFIWTVARGVVRSALVGADIISMSLGGYASSPPKLLWLACDFSYALGVTIVAAAGNDGISISYPGAFPCVIAVGAVDSNNIRASFSGRGNKLEIMAPGVDVLSTMPTYPVTLNGPGYNYDMNYDNLSGTSMACPHIAGVIALYLSKNGARVKNELVRQRLRESAVDLGEPGFDELYGNGLVNTQGILQFDDASDSIPSVPSQQVKVISQAVPLRQISTVFI